MSTSSQFFFLLAIAMAIFISMALKEHALATSLDRFLLADRRVGIERTSHNSWGVGFSFANGLWFSAILGYSYGWWALLFQAVWSFSIIIFGIFVSGLALNATRDGQTIHGFLGKRGGAPAAIIASGATTIGYLLNLGFETYFSSVIVARSLGAPDFALPLALGLAVIAGTYCMIGGYAANVTTDKIQNIFGAVAASMVVAALGWTQFPAIDIQQVQSPAPPTYMLVGLLCFLSLFNIVDMANWQMSTSNSQLPPEKRRMLKLAFVRSALLQLAFPSIAGIAIGLLMQSKPGLSPIELLPAAMSSLNSISPTLLAIALVGLVSVTLSTADTYIMAAAHTISQDVFMRQRFLELASLSDEDRLRHGEEMVELVRLMLIPLSVCGTLVFYICLKALGEDNVIAFQFIMYGSALALLAPAFVELAKIPVWRPDIVFPASIAMGVAAGILPFVAMYNGLGWGIFSSTDLSPVFTLASSELVVGLAGLVGRNGRDLK